MARMIITAVMLIGLEAQAQTTVLFYPSNNNVKDAWIWSFPQGRDMNFGKENVNLKDLRKSLIAGSSNIILN